MFGAEEHDWLAPYESVYAGATHEDAGATRPRATKGATVYKAAKGATVYKGAKGATVYKGLHPGLVRMQQAVAIYGQSPQFLYAAGYGPQPLKYAPKGAYPPHPGLRGYGDIDVPYTTSHGVSATAHMTQQTQCGDAFGVQQTLTDLGYPVAIDGIIGPETFTALDSFAAAQGIAYTHGSYPIGAMCQAMEDAWTQAHGQPSPTTPDQPNVPVPANPNTGIVDSTKTWWGNLPTASKYLVAGTGAVAAAVLVAALVKTPKTGHGRA